MDGLTYLEIADELKCSKSYVAKVLSNWRKERGVATREQSIQIQLNGALAAMLGAAAEERGITTRALVVNLLATIVKDDMFNAVLDD